MPLYAGELNVRRGAPLAEYPASLGQVLDAQAQDTRINNPTNALLRLNEITSANSDRMVDPGAPELGIAPTYEPVQRLDAETARARVKDEGLPLNIPDDGISSRALDILINAKRQELQRQNVFARGPTGFGPGAARLGTALINSLYDPLNIASAFVPVVGEARYAAMLGRAASSFGRAGVRMGVGAAEGAVGAAMLEPLVYAANKAEQLDYTMADSLANIAFGGLFGGGLHAGGGAVRDILQPNWWRDGTGADISLTTRESDIPLPRDSARTVASEATPEMRESALRAAVAQAVEGRVTRVDPILRMERDHIGNAYDAVRANPAGAVDDPTVRLRPRDIGEVLLERGPGVVGEKDGQLTVRPGGYGLLKIIWKHGEDSTADPAFRVTRDDVLNTADVMHEYKPVVDTTQTDGKRLIEWHVPRADGKTVVYGVRGFANDDTKHVVTIFVNEGRSKRLRELPLSERINRPDPESLAGSFHGFRQDTNPAAFSIGPRDGQVGGSEGTVARPDAMAQARAEAQKNAAPESIRSADPEGSAAAERTVRESSKQGRADLDAAEAELSQSLDVAEQLADLTGTRDDLNAALKPYAADIKRAEQYAAALKAGAACGIA